MATSSPAVTFSGVDKLAQAIGQHDKTVKRAIAYRFQKAKPESEDYAKANAPWTDRTGNARAGLHATVSSEESGNIFELLMAGSVFYQVFLETRWNGKYAILMPTINWIGAKIMAEIGDEIEKLQKEAGS